MECFITEKKVERMDLELKLEEMSFHSSLTGKIYDNCNSGTTVPSQI
jgi:hypothetical protein